MAFDPHRHRVQLFTGKGGVGKSSVVAAHALASAAAGHRPLVVELGHRATMESIFDVAPIGYEPTPVGDGVHACNLVLEDALTDYVREQVKVRALASRIVRQPTLRRFFEAAPAVNEVVALRRLARLADSGAFHPILVDLDATGHALMFLGLADVFEGLVGAGPLQTILDATTSLLHDAERTVLHLVTLPAELPAREAIQLHARLVAERRVALGSLVINRVPSPPFDATDEAALDALEAFVPADVALGRRALRRVEHAHARVAQLRHELPLPTVVLAESDALRAAGSDRRVLSALGRDFAAQLGGAA
ncbi:MAG: hypothetical protein H6722_22560 [Sandaracinus sp.]|nr:hypothetical protein [Sandaracinus sp.]